MALLSRVAESLYWMGRYVERAENTARLLDVTYHGRLEPGAVDLAGGTNTWEALITTLGVARKFSELYSRVTEQDVLDFLTFSRLNSSSIVSSLVSARENARGCRDQLSSETWIAINRLHPRPCQHQQPANILRGHKMPRRPHHMRPYNQPLVKRLLNRLMRPRPHPLVQTPLRIQILLRLHRPIPPHHLGRRPENRLIQMMAIQPLGKKV